MATTIVTKSGSGAPTTSDLVAGELAVDLTNKRLYTEDSGGTVLELGTNPSGNVTFGDNGKAIFGAGSDLQIYHNATSNIIDSSVATLAIQAPQFVVQDDTGAKNIIWVTQPAASVFDVRLSYDGTTKLATTATGIDVTGIVDASDLVRFGVNNSEIANNYVRFKPTGAAYIDHSVVGQNINFRLSNASSLDKTPLVISPTGIDVTGSVTADGLTVSTATGSATPVPTEIIIKSETDASDWSDTLPWGRVNFYSQDGSTNGPKTEAAIDVTKGGAGGGVSQLSMSTCNSTTGSLEKRISIEPDGDISFYEDTGTTPKFFWDSSAEALGIGTSSPNTKFHVSSTTTTKSVVETTGTTSDALIELTKGQGSGNTWSMGIDHSNSSAFSLAYLSNGSPSLTTHGLLTVDTSGKVGIGTATPATALDVSSSASTVASFRVPSGGGSNNKRLEIGTGGDRVIFKAYTDSTDAAAALAFQNGGNEAMRIDASGNLLVSDTTANPSGDNVDSGIALHNAGLVRASTNNAAAPLDLNVKGRDGTIAEFRKDGTAVGSIGTEGGDLTIGNADTGLQFVNTSQIIRPQNLTTNAAVDAQVSLGQSAYRFKDLYLSGGVKLSGSSGIDALSTSVSTSAVVITSAVDYGTLSIVAGNSAGNIFTDLVFWATTMGATVVTSGTVSGGPAARTYTVVGSALKLAMASGTYAVKTTNLKGSL
jgi:hypothetical protein